MWASALAKVWLVFVTVQVPVMVLAGIGEDASVGVSVGALWHRCM